MPGRRLAAAVLGGALLAVLGGCGLKTAPRPASLVVAAPTDVAVRRRADAAVVSWPVPAPAVAERWGGVAGFHLLVHRLPLFCRECPPESLRRVALPADSAALRRVRGRYHHALALEPGPALLRVRVVAEYGTGRSRPSDPVVVEPAVDVPAPDLRWRWAAPPGPDTAARAARVQFHWGRHRERIVRVIGTDGHPRTREVFFRANLYRRVVPEPWPLAPLNDQPLQATAWTVPLLPANGPAEPGRVEFVLRLVSRLGSEGPPSPPVTFALPPGTP